LQDLIKQDPSSAYRLQPMGGVILEIQFWPKKLSNLSSIQRQLESLDMRRTLDALNLAQSPLVPQFADMAKQLSQNIAHAKETACFTAPLADWFRGMHSASLSAAELISNLPQILHMLLLVWKHSSYYRRPARMVRLLRNFSQDIIQFARVHASAIPVFSADLNQVHSAISEAIQLCAAFRGCYHDTKLRADALASSEKSSEQETTKSALQLPDDHVAVQAARAFRLPPLSDNPAPAEPTLASSAAGKGGRASGRPAGANGGGTVNGSSSASVAVNPNDASWPPRNSAIFQRLNRFMDRLDDVRFYVETVLDFSALAEFDASGPQWRTLSLAVSSVAAEFSGTRAQLERQLKAHSDYPDLFDLDDPLPFDSSHHALRSAVRVHEENVGIAIQQCLEAAAASDVSAAVRLISQLWGLCGREGVRRHLMPCLRTLLFRLDVELSEVSEQIHVVTQQFGMHRAGIFASVIGGAEGGHPSPRRPSVLSKDVQGMSTDGVAWSAAGLAGVTPYIPFPANGSVSELEHVAGDVEAVSSMLWESMSARTPPPASEAEVTLRGPVSDSLLLLHALKFRAGQALEQCVVLGAVLFGVVRAHRVDLGAVRVGAAYESPAWLSLQSASGLPVSASTSAEVFLRLLADRADSAQQACVSVAHQLWEAWKLCLRLVPQNWDSLHVIALDSDGSVRVPKLVPASGFHSDVSTSPTRGASTATDGMSLALLESVSPHANSTSTTGSVQEPRASETSAGVNQRRERSASVPTVSEATMSASPGPNGQPQARRASSSALSPTATVEPQPLPDATLAMPSGGGGTMRRRASTVPEEREEELLRHLGVASGTPGSGDTRGQTPTSANAQSAEFPAATVNMLPQAVWVAAETNRLRVSTILDDMHAGLPADATALADGMVKVSSMWRRLEVAVTAYNAALSQCSPDELALCFDELSQAARLLEAGSTRVAWKDGPDMEAFVASCEVLLSGTLQTKVRALRAALQTADSLVQRWSAAMQHELTAALQATSLESEQRNLDTGTDAERLAHHPATLAERLSDVNRALGELLSADCRELARGAAQLLHQLGCAHGSPAWQSCLERLRLHVHGSLVHTILDGLHVLVAYIRGYKAAVLPADTDVEAILQTKPVHTRFA
jgi:hypothetical protein